MQNDVILITQFNRKNVIVKDKKGNVLDFLHVSTLHKINYDTKLGKNMIVFSGTL
jgi:hypothetical protein